MSTVGVELNDYINPGWTWKTVTRGYRSGTRRTRKSVARTWTMGFGLADESDGKADDTLVSDTEKLGVAVLGQRFGDQVEHLPIKKRKLSFCSPSPPPNIEVKEWPVNFEHGSDQFSFVNSGSKRRCRALNCSIATRNSSIVDQEIFEGNERNIVYSDDFSGIEILADVACSDGMGVGDDNGEDISSVEGLIREQIEPSISTVPLKEIIASSEIINTSPKDSVGKESKDIVERLSFQNGSSVQKYHDSSDDMSTNQPLPVRDHRLHWDLNVVMDAWEEPSDVISDYEQKNVLGSVSLDGDEGIQPAVVDRGREHEDTKEDLVDRVVSSDLLRDVNLHLELRGSDANDQKIDVEGQEPRMCFVLKGDTDQFAATLNGLECSTESLSSVKASAQTMNVGKSLDVHVNYSSKGVYEGSLAVSPPHTAVKQMTGSCALDSEILCADSVQSKPTDVSCPVQDVDTVCCEIHNNILNEDGEESGGGSGVHVDDTEDSQEMKTGSVGVKTSADSIAEINFSMHVESEELMQKSCGASAVVEECQVYGNGPSSGSCKVGGGDPSDDSYDSDVSQDDTVHIAGKENSKVLQAGYDSQFEDGELREEDLFYREENEGEDGEVKQVDYGSEFEEDRFCGMEVESDQKKIKNETGSSPATDEVIKHIEHCSKGDDSKEKPLSLDKRIPDVSDGCKTEKHTDYCVDQHDVKDFHSRVTDFRACKRELLSRIEGPLSSDTLHRKDPVFFPRSRQACVDKFVGRDRRSRSPVRRNFLNSSGGHWESKHRQSPSYWRSYASGHPRPRSIVEGRGYKMISDNKILEEAEETGFENRTRKQNWNSSNGVYRPLIRRRPLAERENAYDVDTEMVHVRDTSPKSRLERYPEGIRRAIQEDYHRSMPDNSTEYSDRLPHHFARRDRSLSPLNAGRPHYKFPFEKSGSRSRSRTPSAWFLSGERNDGGRHHNRPPVLRSNGRVDRVRFPFQKRFAVDYEDDFMSPPRGCVSPQQDSRWFDDRNNALDPFRGRKLPVRAFGQSHSFDSVRVARRLNSDEYSRPAMRPKRFLDIPSAARGCEYEGSDDDRRKRSNRYEMNQVRSYNADGHHSRSPVLRSNGRVDGVRFPFQQRFAVDYEEDFVSPPRGCVSPQHDSRWFDDRNDALDPLRGRKSPVRAFRQQI
ncbi:Dentin sialophosphoprotein-related putative isoform 1 [Tripterygium wilfordii]|uniref:Dentin sialophosphoprotein-related putative isoform 1 n=1 Tax=Tripterygium wilfordii TaxID=458696 RepID=A0A7J7CE52_TRIWF|nr:uncharacterized protein LOC119984831 [Tripterygium wilfordii]XP_038684885.1 uncharacterized protein LOC119984831 [Tripterygium wilfordii]XP_038684886.1 uncharacterized protein LOC119984831 [Tripterygium wilfordii]XP_038684887.1 uncharacterized protein LOC119984831 [Tripterygium wilfordii]XP_038684888.1 uncharacterized protein LOC119984831 [Tripterygium wilfordii]XP_038684889.1 uncharacterized protein LOC119984831 [Tripterygium wilfordii]KAF5732382.1 Dentin sialophosphoprotein-related putat